MTVMISSHLLSEIDQMVTAVGIINQGKLIFQDKIEILNEQRRSKLLFQTSNNAVTLSLLRSLHPEPVEKGILFPVLDNPTIGQAVQSLYDNHIQVYRIEEKQRSLEDVFLELTGKAVTL